MSFLSAIGNIIKPVAQVVSALNIPVVSQIASIVGSVGGSSSGVTGSILGSIGSALSGGLKSVVGTVTNIADAVNGLVNDAKSTVGGLISPVIGAVDSITNLARNINDGLVQPIVGPIEAILTAQKNLTTEIHTSLQNGLQGLVKIPGEIANALTSVDQSFNRSMQQLGQQNLSIAEKVIAPAFPAAASEGLKVVSEHLETSNKFWSENAANYGQIDLTQPPNAQALEERNKTQLAHLLEGTSWYDKVGQVLFSLFSMLPMIEEEQAPRLEEFKQLIWRDAPVKLIDPGDIIEAFYREFISQAERDDEILRQGYDESRIALMMALESFLPPVSMVITWYAREQIDEAAARKLLHMHKMDDAQVDAILASELEILGPRAAADLHGRLQAQGDGFLPDSLNSDIPGEVVSVNRRNYIDGEAARYEWLAHWRIPESKWWVNAVWRNVRTREEAYQAFRQANIPKELWEDVFQVEEKLWELWLVPDVIAAGVGNDAYWQEQLAMMGFNPTTAQVVMDYGKSKSKASKATTAGDLQKLSLGNSKTLYDDGAITETQYEEILIEHGYSQDAAALTVKLAQITNAIAQRKQYATGLVDDVKLGLMTLSQMEAQLYTDGYTNTEVAKYLIAAGAAKKVKLKMPTESQLDKMLKGNIIDAAQWEQAMVDLGYDPNWIPYLAQII